jgi:hypothetical protein
MFKNLLYLLCFPVLSVAQCWQSVEAGNGFNGGYGHTLAIQNDGTLWVWGAHNYGKLGIPSLDINTPHLVPGSTWLSASAGGVNSAGIKSDGSLWAWGGNSNGQLGSGSCCDQWSSAGAPIRVGNDNDWQSVSVGDYAILAIKSNGTLWGIGRNIEGQLGLGTVSIASYITQIGTANNWKQVTANNGYSIAVKTNGTLWMFGKIYISENLTLTSNIPMQVSNDADWNKISDTGNFAIKNDGTLWTFGHNDYGQLGTGNTIGQSTPVQIGTDTWLEVSGNYNRTFAIRTDGTLWGWGYNDSGILGDGTTTWKYIPTQIGSQSDWDSVSIGDGYSTAIKSNGTIYTWGQNSFGQLGNGMPTYVNSFIPSPIVSCESLEIENTTANQFAVYPNPTNDIVYISTNENSTVDKIVICDLTGKELLIKTNNLLEIDLSSLSSGLYFLKINSGEIMQIFKIVKN